MKRRSRFLSGLITVSIAISSMLIPGNVVQAATTVNIDSTNFPDKAFRKYVAQFDLNSNGVLSEKERQKVTEMYCMDLSIESLEGIDNFTNLVTLDCANNSIDSLDLSKNTKLETINCNSCKMTSLVLGSNTNLKELACSDNELTAFSINKCTNLEKVECYSNKLTKLVVQYCPNLKSISCGDNQLEKLYVTKNTELEYLNCSDNSLSSLNLTNCSKLIFLNVSNNNFEKINVSNNVELDTLLCSNNKLTALDVSSLSMLRLLGCDNNEISELNVSNNTYLGLLHCENNKLTELTKLPKQLTNVDCSNNQIASLDFSNDLRLLNLNCSNNALTELKLYSNGYLKELNCANNQLTNLEIYNNSLHILMTYNNSIEYLDLDSTQFSKTNWGTTYEYEPVVKTVGNYYAATDDFDSIAHLLRVPKDQYINEFPSVLLDGENRVFYVEECLIVDNTTEVSGTSFVMPTAVPTVTPVPSEVPTVSPTVAPTVSPTSAPTSAPTLVPTSNPTSVPTVVPTAKPTSNPTVAPTVAPTAAPTSKPTSSPEVKPTSEPTSRPTSKPTNKPTVAPTNKPATSNTPNPTVKPAGTTVAPETTSNPTSVPTSKPTATPGAVKPTENPSAEVDKESDVGDFVERLYTTCLGRKSEDEGKAYWVEQLKEGVAGSDVARGFFFSPEFVGFDLSDGEYITRLYRTFMNREPEQEGIEYWEDQLASGKDRVFVFDGFINSPEWADICLTYGIRSGGITKATFEKTASSKVVAFAERLYTTCLCREAEEAGLKFWSQELANLRQTGTEAARGFFFSEEFVDFDTSNEEYVTRLYRTFMGREPDKKGYKYWVDELKNGKSRLEVFDGFSIAPEFGALCVENGIIR